MQRNASMEDAFSTIRSFEWIHNKLLEEAKNEKHQPEAEDLFLKAFGLTTEFWDIVGFNATLRKVSSSLVQIKTDTEKRRLASESLDPEESQASISEEELEIAGKLRNCCDVFGKERDHQLRQSSGYLLELGKLYLRYATDGKGVDQKLNFIRSAVLVTGAMVRFQKINLTDELQRAKQVMEKLHEEYFKSASVQSYDFDLLGFIRETKLRLAEYREKVTVKLKNITQVTENENDDEEVRKQNQRLRIEQIKEIYEESTRNYIDIFRRIAEMCKKVLGEAPCKFVIAGLGSLARQEVTLYSDFEHVIILEDDVPDDPSMREYFRWFTTLFHISIVEFGETVIPSVNVRSLCDLYSSDQSKKWFFDEYTPCGISFDGMMPHACKIPLGRPKETKLRRHTVELIQPVSVMAKYLTYEEEIKNGYFLSDVLSKTCFVYGNHDVYERFREESRIISHQKTSHEIAIQEFKNWLLNQIDSVFDACHFHFLQKMNIKGSIYRPITYLLSSISSMYGAESHSTFQMIEELQKSKFVDDESADRLMYTVAIALEVRLRTYSITDGQRRRLTHSEVAELVGEKDTIDCYVTLSLLSDIKLGMIFEQLRGNSWQKLVLPAVDSAFWKISSMPYLMAVGNCTKSLNVGLTLVRQIYERYESFETNASCAKYFLKKSYCSLVQCLLDFITRKLVTGDEADFSLPDSSSFKMFEWCCHVLKELTDESDRYELMIYHLSMAMLHRYKEQYKSALAELEQHERSFHMYSTENISPEQSMLWSILEMDTICRALEGNELLNRMKEMLENSKHYVRRCILNIGLSRALLKVGEKSEARKNLLSLVMDVKGNTKVLGIFRYRAVLSTVLAMQSESDFILDSLATANLLSDIPPDLAIDDEKWSIHAKFLPSRKYNLSFQKLLDQQKVDDRERSGSSLIEHMQGMAMQWRLQQIYTAFSYRDMMEAIFCMIRRHKQHHKNKQPIKAQAQKSIDRFLAGCWMACFEKVLIREFKVNLVITEFSSTAGRVKSLRSIQPFAFAFFADACLHLRRKGHSSCLLDQIVTQKNIFKSLFGCLEVWRPLKTAIDLFTHFKFRPCVIQLWRMLQWEKTSGLLRKKTAELFVTTLMTMIIFTKRRNPPEYFHKTREISLRQSMNAVSRDKTFLSLQVFLLWRLYCFRRGSLVPVYNLAVECLFCDEECGVGLLWKILHASRADVHVKRRSIKLMCIPLYRNARVKEKNLLAFRQLCRSADTLDLAAKTFEHMYA